MLSLNGIARGRPHLRAPLAVATSAVAALLTGACASTGATFRSGVGDAFLEHPPYYAGTGVSPAAATGHLPVVYQRGAAQPAIFDPTVTPPMAGLLEAMNDYLDSLGVTVPLAESERVSAASHAATGVPPDVRFGCATESGAPDDDCAERGDNALGRGRQTMHLAVGRPSPEWTAWMQGIMDDAGIERALVITLEIGHYLIRQRGLRGTKEVELGTSHVERLPWLTSLETPVSVFQLTGAVVGRDGRAIRIGAEGLLARRTSLALSSIGAQALITNEDVERLLTARRDDLPGAPLTWQVGLRALVAQLTGHGGLLNE